MEKLVNRWLQMFLLSIVSLSLFFWSSTSYANDSCPTLTIGLCTPGVTIETVETIDESTELGGDGITTTITTTTDITTTTITNEDSNNILDGSQGYVSSSKEGDMDSDWGGQGSASMPSGATCGDLGTDRCAMITGSGSSTSAYGVSGMGTTFINTVNISDLRSSMGRGGRTTYRISVDKQDSQDRIYLHLRGKDGNTTVFSGTDILSETGVNSQYQTYEGGWDFSGQLSTVIVEVGGRDINLAVGPMFDDVEINILYNVVNTIVTQQITTVEEFIALNGYDTETIEIVEDIFETNDVIVDDFGDIEIVPDIEMDTEVTYETVELELEIEIPDIEIEMPEIELSFDNAMMDDLPEVNVEIEVEMEMEIVEVSVEVETESVNEVTTEPQGSSSENTEDTSEDVQEPSSDVEKPVGGNNDDESDEGEGETESSKEDTVEESKSEPEPEEKSEPEPKTEKTEQKETEEKEQKQEQKQKAATKIVKKMGDKGRYDSENQIKTLIVMQVLGNTKDFFDTKKIIPDVEGFFTDATIPGGEYKEDNYLQYFLFGGSDIKHKELIESQYRRN